MCPSLWEWPIKTCDIINLGDVIEAEDRIYGDGVNIAARLEGLAEEGGICISGTAYDQVKNKLPFRYEYQGEQVVKNIREPIRVYKVLIEKAMRLNPHYPANFLYTLAFAYSAMERYEEAMATLKRALPRSPDHLGIHILLATFYNEIGRDKEARWHVSEALRINPELSIEDLRQRLPAALPERGIDALRKAGLPE